MPYFVFVVQRMVYTMWILAIEAAFLEHEWWIQFHESKVDLWIDEDQLIKGRMIIVLG